MPTVPPPVSRAPVSGTPWVPRADGALVRAILKHTPRSPTSFASRTRPAEAPVPPRTPDATRPLSTTPRFSLTGSSDPGCPCVSAMYPSPPCSTLTRHVVRLHLQQSAGTAARPSKPTPTGVERTHSLLRSSQQPDCQASQQRVRTGVQSISSCRRPARFGRRNLLKASPKRNAPCSIHTQEQTHTHNNLLYTACLLQRQA